MNLGNWKIEDRINVMPLTSAITSRPIVHFLATINSACKG